jgi:hypothetical protein
VFEISAGRIDIGASISFLSQYAVGLIGWKVKIKNVTVVTMHFSRSAAASKQLSRILKYATESPAATYRRDKSANRRAVCIQVWLTYIIDSESEAYTLARLHIRVTPDASHGPGQCYHSCYETVRVKAEAR